MSITSRDRELLNRILGPCAVESMFGRAGNGTLHLPLYLLLTEGRWIHLRGGPFYGKAQRIVWVMSETYCACYSATSQGDWICDFSWSEIPKGQIGQAIYYMLVARDEIMKVGHGCLIYPRRAT